MASGRDTKVDRIIRNLKNRPAIAVVVVLTTIVIALGAFTNALRTLWSVVPSSEAQLEVMDVRFVSKREDVIRLKQLWVREPLLSSDPFTGGKGEFHASGMFPFLDVKLRNKGKEVAVLHALEIGVSRKTVQEYEPTLCSTAATHMGIQSSAG